MQYTCGEQHYYHGVSPQTNGQAERFNSTVVSKLRQYVSEYWIDWDTYQLALTYPYSGQRRRSIKLFPFSLALTHAPPKLANFVVKQHSLALDYDATFLLYATLELARRATSHGNEGDKSSKMAEEQYERLHDCHVWIASTCSEGEEV